MEGSIFCSSKGANCTLGKFSVRSAHSEGLAKNTSAGKMSYCAFENSFKSFVEAKRASGKFVSPAMVHEEAIRALQDPDMRFLCGNKTTVSYSYILKFLKRFHLRLKYVKRQSSLTPETVARKAQQIHCHLYRCLKTRLCSFVLNFDEIPITLSGKMGSVRTITEAGDHDVRVNLDPNDFKITGTLLTGAGVILETFTVFRLHIIIVLKGSPKRSSVRNEAYDSRTKRAWTPKGVVTSVFYQRTFLPDLKRVLEHNKMSNGVAIFDSCKVHMTENSLDAMRDIGCFPCIIPSSCTSWLQWIDTDFASCYKGKHFQFKKCEQYVEITRLIHNDGYCSQNSQ